MRRVSDEIQVRLIREEEIDAVSELAMEVFNQFVGASYSPAGQQEFLSYAAPGAIRERQRSGHLTLVAEVEGRLAGMLHLRNGNHVAMLFVRGKTQRQGVGRALVNEAIARARTLQPSPRFMTVNSSPNALEAYQRLRFTPVGPEQTIKGIRFIPMALAL